MTHSNERRPAVTHEATESLDGLTPSISPNADQWQRLASHVDGAFVVLVETSHGRYRRRVWLTIAPAERAAQKARDAGHNAVVMLAELKPLYEVVGAVPDVAMLGRVVVASGGVR